jgi:hypothetical protein
MVEKTHFTTLDGLTTGRFVVTTRSGTRHYVDLDAQTSIRVGAPGREWKSDGVGLGPVTPDGSLFCFDSIQDATVGKSMWLDNRHEWRITSEIQSIEKAPEAEDQENDACYLDTVDTGPAVR